MSTNLAYARPAAPSQWQPQPRHVQIVTTRAQRKARPRVVYAVVTVASLFLIFAIQLLLSIVVSDGVYQISGLQGRQKELLRSEQALMEQLQVLDSSQHLALNAAHLGMVPGASPLYLDISTGAVSSAPGSADPVGCGGACNLIPNSLLANVPLVDASAATVPAAAVPKAVAPVAPALAAAPATTDPDVLPAPVTR